VTGKMESSGSVEVGKSSSTDTGVSTLPSVYPGIVVPPVDTRPSTTPTPPSTGVVNVEFIRSADGLLKAIEIVRLLCINIRISTDVLWSVFQYFNRTGSV